MGIHIYNITHRSPKLNSDLDTYELFINHEHICNFQHKRSNGLAECLRRAAEAVDREGGEKTMKERPILFSTPMVKAILEGRKTMTRRVIKPQPDKLCGGYMLPLRTSCPHGWIGDRLWVRETFQTETVHGFTDSHGEQSAEVILYKSDDIAGHITSPWRPSIYMPRWASRINLEITGVRIERVQEITEEDAKSEGSEYLQEGDYLGCGFRNGFKELWDTINKKRGYGWDENPWVWIIEFRRI